jgi:hypothetical protein
MKRQLLTVTLTLAIPCLAVAQTATAPTAKAGTALQPKVAAVPYGSNRDAGGTFVHDGVTLYYEVYGQGEPLLIIHGNGGSIGTLAAQIAFFRSRFRVIAMDSRDQGNSGDSPGKLTYEKMTDDLAALLDHLKTGPVDVLGWSDGGGARVWQRSLTGDRRRRIMQDATAWRDASDSVFAVAIIA